MCHWISGWSRRLLAVVCGVFASAILALASAAPVLAKTSKPFHGGAHGRVNTLVQWGHVMPLHAHDLVAFGVAAAVVGIAVAVERRFVGRGGQSLRHMRRPSARADQTKSRGRAV